MPKEKYDPPDPRRMYTIMSSEEAANGKKSYWAELEISGEYCQGVPSFVGKVVVLSSYCSQTSFDVGTELKHMSWFSHINMYPLFVYLFHVPFMSHYGTQAITGSSLIK